MQPAPEHGAGTTVLVVPCYNEEKRLPIETFHSYLEQTPHVQYLFVNDGSSDGTRNVLDDFAASRPERIRVLHLPSNQGKGEAVRQGLQEALAYSPQFVGYWDADLATPLEELGEFEQLLRENETLKCILGARVRLMGRQIERKRSRHYVGRFFATAFSNILRQPIYDTQCGAKLLRNEPTLQSALAEPFLSRWLFDLELLLRYIYTDQLFSEQACAQVLCEVPLQQWRDVGESKVRLSHSGRILRDMFTLWKRYRLPMPPASTPEPR